MKKKKLLNGWTRAKVMKAIEKKNKGYCSKEGKCLYRGPNKNMCFIGALIPNKEYDDAMENNAAETLYEDFPRMSKILPFFAEDAANFQSIHDDLGEELETEELHKRAKKWLDKNFL